MRDLKRKQLQILTAILVIIIGGTLGYYYLEKGWTLADSFYMVIITITTVGYGEVHQLSEAGRIFTSILILVGLGTAATFVSNLARFIIESEIKGLYGRRKMLTKIKKLKDHFIICGYKNIGSAISLKLYEANIPFVIIDQDEEALVPAKQRSFLYLKGNAMSDSTLLSAGIENAAGLILCTRDFSTTVSICLAARELNKSIYIITHGEDPSIESRIIRAGADNVVYPMKLGGEQIAQLLLDRFQLTAAPTESSLEAEVMGYCLRVYQNFSEKELTVKEVLEHNHALKAIELKRKNGESITDPEGDHVLEHEDSLLILVKKASDEKREHNKIDFTWNDDWLMGISELDDEHRSLFSIIKKYYEAYDQGKEKEELKRIFDKLLDYTVNHFHTEEYYMEKFNYPETEGHKKKHRELTRQVMEINKNKMHLSSENIGDFLYSWLVDHIRGNDLELGKFLQNSGVQ